MHPARQGRPAAALDGRAATCTCTSTSARPTSLDEQQERLLRQLADIRHEDVAVGHDQGGLFSKVRDAWSGSLTPPLFLHPDLAGARRGDTVVLDGDEGRHAARVKRALPGETLLLGDGHGTLLTCRVVTVDGAG